jgi:hypothetical protein
LPAPHRLLAFTAGAAAAGLGVGVLSGGGLALVSCLAAVALAIGVPLRAGEDLGRGLAEGLALALGAGLAGLVFAPGWGALGVAMTLVVSAAGLAAWTGALRGLGAQPIVTCLALGWISLPYWGAIPLGVLNDVDALRVVLHSPLPILCGTFAGVDLLRAETLYRLLPQGQSVPYTYVAPLAGLAASMLPAALGSALLFLRRRGKAPRLRPIPAALLAFALLAAAPQTAQAQGLFPAPRQPSDNFEIGDMVTRVNLGYYVPRLTGFFQIVGQDGTGDKFHLNRDADLEPLYVMPTFEIALNWDNGGEIVIEYMEGVWHGQNRLEKTLDFEENLASANDSLDTKYRFRSLALLGSIDLPVADWLKFMVLTTNRYMKFEVEVETDSGVFEERNSSEGYAPAFGVGVDVLVWNVISAYGDIQWLDFTTEVFGGETGEYKFRYHEWRAGVRLELVQHAHISLEYYVLDLKIVKGESETFVQSLTGFRLFVSVLF